MTFLQSRRFIFLMTQSIVLLCAAGILVYEVASGKYAAYVTPRLIPLLLLCATIFIVWTWHSGHRVVRESRTVNRAIDSVNKDSTSVRKIEWIRLFVIVIPMILLLLPYSAFTSESSTASLGSPPPIADEFTAKELNANHLPGLNTHNKTITVDANHFGPWIEQIRAHPDLYKNYSISITGFVSTTQSGADTRTSKNTFAISRMLMTCCVQDMTAFGMNVQYAKSSSLTANTWVHVEGTIRVSKAANTGAAHSVEIVAKSVTSTSAQSGYFYR